MNLSGFEKDAGPIGKAVGNALRWAYFHPKESVRGAAMLGTGLIGIGVLERIHNALSQHESRQVEDYQTKILKDIASSSRTVAEPEPGPVPIVPPLR